MSLPKFLGLDIGNHSIKAILLGGVPDKLKLEGSAYGSTPLGIIMSDSEENQKILSQAIRDIIKSSNLASTKKVVFAIPESHVNRRLITLPYVDEDTLQNSVYWEMKQYLPVPIDEVTLETIIIGEKMKDDTRVADVLAIAVDNKYISRYMKVLEMAGLEPIAAETEAVATVRAISNLAKDLNSSYLIVDFGSQSTDVCVVFKDKLLYSDSISYGSDAVTKAIAQTFAMDSMKADEYKKTFGLEEEHFQGTLANVIKPVIDTILIEVRKSLEYFRREFPDIAPTKIFLTGEAGLMPGLIKYMGDKLEIAIELANPWANIKVDDKDLNLIKKGFSAYTVAIGLAQKTDIF